jgi:hypothetical protein
MTNPTITQATNEILDAFRTGRLAEPLAQTFLHSGLHCKRWSFTNQMLVHLFGFGDAATYKQWQALGRQVKRGAHAIYLMRANLKLARVTDEETGEERIVQAGLRGFGWFPVHGLEDTLPIPDFQAQPYDAAVASGRAFVSTLPLLNVAEAWGIEVVTYQGHQGRGLGYARPGQQIGLGVANLSTWAHEMVHQAEHRLGSLTKRGQDREQEIVAELGGASQQATPAGRGDSRKVSFLLLFVSCTNPPPGFGSTRQDRTDEHETHRKEARVVTQTTQASCLLSNYRRSAVVNYGAAAAQVGGGVGVVVFTHLVVVDHAAANFLDLDAGVDMSRHVGSDFTDASQ